MKNIKLSEKMDLKYADELKSELIESQGLDVNLDGAHVSAMFATCCQVLVAAKIAWIDRGKVLSISPSENMIRDLETLGAKKFLIAEEIKL
ncbi:MAG: STAS domain-containing protein [Heliomarina sp.]|uniref:STAS domain-containing protein n=1 Tax=Heliomarina sp. TaxID=2917556 RepID=UPI0040594796